MQLSVHLEAGYANLMRGSVSIGRFVLDRHGQISEVVVGVDATPDEDEKIIRLAASHVAQYVVDRTISYVGGLMQETIPSIPGLKPEHSAELLNFENIAPQHNRLSAGDLECVLGLAGVKIKRRAA